MFRAHRAHYQERHNKTSGKCHSVLVAVSCAHDTATNTGNQQIITTKQVYHQPANDTTTNTEWQLPEVVLIQFVSPDDEHDVLETCREL